VKLLEAVVQYVARRRSEGAPFISSDVVLRSLCKFCGDIDLRGLTTVHIARFLDTSNCAAVTRTTKFSAVKCFVEHCCARNQLATLTLQKPTSPKTTRAPYIYTHGQVHALFVAAQRDSCKKDSLDGGTLRMILLILYATGASLPEVLSLRRSGIDMPSQLITFGAQLPGRRTVPVGADLRKVLHKYLTEERQPSQNGDLMFACKDGRPIKRTNLWYHFVKLHKEIGLAKTTAGHEPRLQDLRFTFAVHRLSYCIQRGENLTELIPALSSYMGYSSLTKAEQYLAYVSERFSGDLRKLSPKKGQKHWRDEPGLLGYLHSL
jgi:integrase/recombinase XerD